MVTAASLILAIAAFFPSLQALIAAHPEMFTLSLSGLFTFLRAISHGKINVSSEEIK